MVSNMKVIKVIVEMLQETPESYQSLFLRALALPTPLLRSGSRG